MDIIKNKIKLNNNSLTLVNQFSKLNIDYNREQLRNNLFDNDLYLKFLNIVQNKFLKTLSSDYTINKIMSSAFESSNISKFYYKLLDNSYEKPRRSTSNTNYHDMNTLDSKFMSKNVAKLLDTKRIYVVQFKEEYCGVKLELNFYSDVKFFDSFINSKSESKSESNYKSKSKSVLDKKNIIYQKIVRILRRIVFVIDFFNKNTCYNGEILNFDLLLLDPIKKLPDRRSEQLDAEYINSGYTTFYNDADNKKTIIIYRDEEMEKLIIHELIHFFMLDFTYLDINLSKYINVSSEIEFIPNESYTEFITVLIHTAIIPIENEFKKAINAIKPIKSSSGSGVVKILNSNNIYTKGIDKKEVFYLAIELLYNEILFGYFQCAKILYQYNIGNIMEFIKTNYVGNINKNERGIEVSESKEKVLFWQSSCILSYFFIKVALLTNLPKSIVFFLSNQTNFKINTSNLVKTDFENLISSSLKLGIYKENIQIALDEIHKIIFNPNVEKQLSKKCKINELIKRKPKSKTKKCVNSLRYINCVNKIKENYKTLDSFKKSKSNSYNFSFLKTKKYKYKNKNKNDKSNSVNEIITTTRMSLFEL